MQPPPPGAWPVLLGSALTWLCPQVQAILRGQRPGPWKEPREGPAWPVRLMGVGPPCPTVGAWGELCAEVLGVPVSSRNPRAGFSLVPQKPSPTESAVSIGLGAPGSEGLAWPSAYKVLEGRPPERAQQSHTLIAERSPCLRGHRGIWEGGLETCAHVCTHVHAYRHTHVHTHVRQGIHRHTFMHTTNARGPRAVAVMMRGPGSPQGTRQLAGCRALSRAQEHRQWRRSCLWWAHRCPQGSTGPRCPGTSWS